MPKDVLPWRPMGSAWVGPLNSESESKATKPNNSRLICRKFWNINKRKQNFRESSVWGKLHFQIVFLLSSELQFTILPKVGAGIPEFGNTRIWREMNINFIICGRSRWKAIEFKGQRAIALFFLKKKREMNSEYRYCGMRTTCWFHHNR